MNSQLPPADAWQRIDYRPVVPAYSPIALLQQLPAPVRVLEIGCGNGAVARELARSGHIVTGIDINVAAALQAQHDALASGLESQLSYAVADARQLLPRPRFDVVVLIRVLTCFPDMKDWRRMLEVAQGLLVPSGLLYVHDFLFDTAQEAYRTRYAVAAAQGWREGTFLVADTQGQPTFVALHHTKGDLSELMAPYNTLHFERHEGRSMHGNPCMMFEFIGRRTVERAELP